MPAPIAVLGGTFDPPHIGHLVLGESVASQFGCGRVLFVPAGDPYRKSGTDTPENRRSSLAHRTVTPGDARLEMTRLATSGNDRFEVDPRELRRAGPSYTVDTLRELHREGHDEIVLVLGSDALADLPNWREPDQIRRLARIVIAEKSRSAPAPPGTFERVDMPLLELSSTLIRERVRAGLPIRYLVPDHVADYIARHNLYRL